MPISLFRFHISLQICEIREIRSQNSFLHFPFQAYWLKDAASRGMKHICWDGCMFSNEILETPSTWQHIPQAMIRVDKLL